MFNGLKAKRQLALYVALGLSTGGGLLFSGTPAYAADVTISSSDTAHSGGVNGTTETGNKDGNNVTIGESGAAGPTINGDVVGGSATAGNVANNKVTINSISLGSGKVIYGGKSSAGAATGNTVTIAGGTLNSNNKIIGGEGTASSTSNGNIVNLGDVNGNFSANLNRAEIWGTSYGGQVQANDSDKIKGNTLNVNASGIRLEKVRNFEKINFNLTPTVTAGSTMLTMDTGSFELGYGKAFDWKNFSLTGKENDTDKTKYGRIGNINLLHAYSGSDMKIGNYTTGGKKGTTGDYEYHMESNGSTFYGERLASLIKANVDRFQNADATADNVTGTAVYGGYSSLGNTTTNNKIRITNTNNTNLNVYGGYTAGAGDSTKNTVTIAGTSKVKNVYGGYVTAANAKAEGNTVNIESGGTVGAHIYGGYANGNGTTTNNTVNLGDADHADFAGTTLTNSEIHGGNKTDVTGNTLNVNAKNIAAKSVGNFENYKFKLNSATAFDDTMLTVTNAGDFAGTGVDLNKITVDSTGLSADYLRTQHGIKRMTLLKRSNDTDTLTFANYAAREAATATETHEFGFVTNNGTGTANALMLEASRFKGSNVTYDGTTPTFGGEVYGGFSRYGHTTTGNTLTVTGKPTSGTPLKYAYGGKNEGAAGAVKDNTATLELPDNNSAIKDVYGGKITNAANAGEVSGNIVNM